MVQEVPVASIIGMSFTAIVSIFLPIVVMIVLANKTKARIVNALIGALTFFVFALILEPVLHVVMSSALGETLTENVIFYAIYGGLAAALFEETGRFLAMKFLMKKSLTKENSLMYGVGHGGAESMIIIGLSYISNIAMSVMINSDMIDSMLEGLEGDLKEQTLAQLSTLWTSDPSLFYVAGLERISAFVLQICLSYLIYRCVKEMNPVYYIIAFLLHFVIDAGTIVLSHYLPLMLVEGILLTAVVIIAVFVYKQYKAEPAESVGV